MFKLTFLFLILFQVHAKSQDFEDFNAVNITSIFNEKNELTNQKKSILKINTKEKNKSANLLIQNIKKKLVLKTIDSYEKDTFRFEEEKGMIDTDFPIPNEEDEKIVLESLMRFINKPIHLETNKEGLFISEKTKRGKPNVVAFFTDKYPKLNVNSILTPFVINFSSVENYKRDTVYCENPRGMFINEYIKSDNGYKIVGQFIQYKLMEDTEKSDVIIAQTIFDYWKYSGELICDKQFIKTMILNNETKYRIVFDNINEEVIQNYKLQSINDADKF